MHQTIYNAVWSGNIKLTPSDLPEILSRQNKKNRVRINKRSYGTVVSVRPEEISARTDEGHWGNGDGHSCRKESLGKESVVLTLVEKKLTTT